jgi:anti-sigma regulatory factor (Ser/Thr protein kinase)
MGRIMKTEKRTASARPAQHRSAFLRLHVVPSARCVRRVREQIATFANENGLLGEGLRDLLTAVGEALANAIEHSRSTDAIDITCWLSSANRFMVNVTDHGVGFHNGTPRAARLPALSAERGRGLPLMRRCSDFFAISSEPHVGTTVTLGRAIRPPRAQPRRATSR